MANTADEKRVDSASRVIKASRQALYLALVDEGALTAWLPPQGMTGHFDYFDAVEGGHYRMTLTYDLPEHATLGKTSESSDVVDGTFLELVPNERVVQQVEFDSDDPAFAGSMLMNWSLADVSGGTEVTIRCENVPEGIRPEDHAEGLQSSLENLAKYTER